VQEVLYATQLKYLLVVLKDQGDSSRQAFLRLTPNSQQLGDAHTGGQLVGVIVTHAGERSSCNHSHQACHLHHDITCCFPFRRWSAA
jgi:hypothetical protein